MNWPSKRSLPPIAAPLGVTAFFLLAALAFWKFRIIDPATLARVSPVSQGLCSRKASRYSNNVWREDLHNAAEQRACAPPTC